MSTDADIIEAVALAFSGAPRPEHFTDHLHCEECADHDRTLQRHDRATLRVDHVNDPARDPLCACSPQGKAYYLPTLVRFALAAPDPRAAPYWQQLLFHLEGDGPGHALVACCTPLQRRAIALFLEHLVESRAADLDALGCTDEVLRTHGHWAGAA